MNQLSPWLGSQRGCCRLLGDQQRAKVVLAAFLHPSDIGLGRRMRSRSAPTEPLRRRRWSGSSGVGGRELVLVAVEDASQDQAREDQRLPAAHLRDVDDAELALRSAWISMSMSWLLGRAAS